MTTLLMMNDYQQFGRNENSSICMNSSGNKKSIKDLIKKFEKVDDKKQDKLSQRIDLISNLNSLKFSSNKNADISDSVRPISLNLNFETIQIPQESVKSYKTPTKNSSNIILNRNTQSLQPNIEISLDDEVAVSAAKYFSEKKIEPFKQTSIEIHPNETTCTWNPSRRKSSVQLLKPSSLLKNKNSSEQDEEYSIIGTEKIILPKRVTGPIYESRRSSFSTIKPSEIWDRDELPSQVRRNSKIIANGQKNNVILEADENEEAEKSSWACNPKNSFHVVKPSNVKSG